MRFKKKQMIYIFSFVFMCLSVPAFAKLAPTYREIHSQLGVDAIVIQVSDLSKLSLALNDPDTLKKYGSFSALQNSLPACQHLVFAMNAGMYHRDREPVGLYIEANQQRTALNTQDGYGNFFFNPMVCWLGMIAKQLLKQHPSLRSVHFIQDMRLSRGLCLSSMETFILNS